MYKIRFVLWYLVNRMLLACLSTSGPECALGWGIHQFKILLLYERSGYPLPVYKIRFVLQAVSFTPKSMREVSCEGLG